MSTIALIPSSSIEAESPPRWVVMTCDAGSSLILLSMREGAPDRSPERRKQALQEMRRASEGIWEGVDVERYLGDLRGE